MRLQQGTARICITLRSWSYYKQKSICSFRLIDHALNSSSRNKRQSLTGINTKTNHIQFRNGPDYKPPREFLITKAWKLEAEETTSRQEKHLTANILNEKFQNTKQREMIQCTVCAGELKLLTKCYKKLQNFLRQAKYAKCME